MVPESVTGPGGSGLGAPVDSSGQPGQAGQFRSHLVGPAGSMAADSAFARALVTLWHRVSSTGEGGLGFVPPVERPAVAARAAEVVDKIKRGAATGVAITVGRELVGFGQLIRGRGLFAHTADIETVMIDPAHQHRGAGATLMGELIGLARSLGVERVGLSVRSAVGLEPFYARFGFVEWGRRTGWIRVGPDDDRDEVFLSLEL